jgi:Na+/H+-dicarboxylate symporter
MKLLASHASHPLLLLLCAAAGTVLGLGPPAWSAPAWGVVYVSTALLNLVCLPLLVVATLSGLRHLLGLPQPAHRLLMIAIVSATLMLICAMAGILTAQWSQIGGQLDTTDQLTLGHLVMGQSPAGEAISISDDQGPTENQERWAVPDNVFGTLSSGDLAAVMFCTLFFGLAFTAQKGSLSDSTVNQLDAIYRALEKCISLVNLALPLLVLAYAAQIASQWNPSLLRAMSSYLLCFWTVCGVLVISMVMVLKKMVNAPLGQVLQALKAPSVLSLVSASPLAAVPASIEGLSDRLGFSRGIVEMLMPTSAVFLRTGAALQYAMLTVFVAHLYGHQISPIEMLTLAPVAVLAALASAGSSGLASLGFAVTVVAHLRLPHEAALPLFAAIHLFCEGPARLLSLLSSCVMTVFVCGGLPVERSKLSQQGGDLQGPVRFSMTRQSVIIMASCVLLSGLLSLILGFALGLRQFGTNAPASTAISISATPASKAAQQR